MHVRPPLSPTDAIVGGREPGGGAAASSGPAGGMTGAGAQTARWTGNGDDRWEDMDSASNASLGSAGAVTMLRCHVCQRSSRPSCRCRCHADVSVVTGRACCSPDPTGLQVMHDMCKQKISSEHTRQGVLAWQAGLGCPAGHNQGRCCGRLGGKFADRGRQRSSSKASARGCGKAGCATLGSATHLKLWGSPHDEAGCTETQHKAGRQLRILIGF